MKLWVKKKKNPHQNQVNKKSFHFKCGYLHSETLLCNFSSQNDLPKSVEEIKFIRFLFFQLKIFIMIYD